MAVLYIQVARQAVQPSSEFYDLKKNNNNKYHGNNQLSES
jgi:hypothetical protein